MSTLVPVSSVSRKRKRDEEKVLLGEPLVIQPHLSSVFDTSLKITPAVLFPRKQVPFNWLLGVPSRLFSAHIPALDTPGNILITKTDGERQLSAVERVSEGVFTLFRLSPLVKMKDVRRLAQQARKAISQAPECIGSDGQDPLKKDWWVDLALSNLGLGPLGSESQAGVLSMIHPSKIRQNLKAKLSLEPANSWLISPPVEASVSRDRNPTETLEQIGSQYLEALYVAKTSIAYFAKSTLSRARVKFQQEISETSGTAPAINQLVHFLRSMIIPLDKMDSKYKKVIMQVVMEETIEDSAILKAGEELYVRRWLSMNFRNESNDPALKHKVGDLKTRETELQIILLLEILALAKDEVPSELEINPQKKKKIKKSSREKSAGVAEPPEPTILLDLLLDRLCIWRSLGPLTTIERPKNTNDRDAEEDQLRDFCMEVVMPFYSSRLPEICATIQKKIGNTTPLPGSATTPLVGLKRRKLSSLSRSKTAPVTTAVSSRNSAPSDLLNLPKHNSKPVDLGAVAKKTLQKREVQIPTLNPKAAVNVDEELKDAITAVAKPNRVAAGVEMMDAITKRFSAARKTKKPLRNPNVNNILVHATPSKKSCSRQITRVNQLSPQGEEDEDSFLPPPRPPTPYDIQPAIFASPVKRSYRRPNLPPASYHIPTSLASTEIVLESSPGHVLNTPVKGGNKIGGKVVLSLGARSSGNTDGDIVPGSSPIKPTRSRSCGLLHWKPKNSMVDSSPVSVDTPLKRGGVTSSRGYGFEDTEGELDNITSKARKSSILGSTLGVANAMLDFSTISRVPDSAVNKLETGNGSLRTRSSIRKSSVEFVAGNEGGEEISIYRSLGWEDEDSLF